MAAFEIMAKGLFKEEDVIVRKSETCVTKSKLISDIIEREWERIKRERIRRGLSVPHPGPQCRLEDCEVRDGKLYLTLGNTKYDEYMGLRNIGDEIKTFLGESYCPNTLAICSAIRTSDNKIMLYRRTSLNAEYPRWIHTVGGHPRFEDKDVFNGMRLEIFKEIGPKPENIEEMNCTGLVRNYRAKKPELIFSTKLRLSASDLEAIPAQEERGEHEIIAMEGGKKQYGMQIDNDPVELASALYRYDRIFVPPGQAALFRYGELEFGKKWADEVFYNLKEMWIRRFFEHTLIERDASESIRLEYGLS